MGSDPITKPLVKAAEWGWERIDPSGLIPKIPDIPSIPPVGAAPVGAAPSGTDSAVKEAADSTKKLEKKRKGALSTILTGWLGDTSAAPVVRKILLGE